MKETFEDLYARFNKREFIHPDPLEFLYDYPDPMDREIAGLIASSLAYGRVEQILKSVTRVLAMLPGPRESLARINFPELLDMFAGFRHRFTSGRELAIFLLGIKKVIETHGSLERHLMSCISPSDTTIIPALCKFTQGICAASDVKTMYLLPDPTRGSACKRPLLFLRWMIRRDQVDPGGWSGISPSMLVVPLDTHMFRISKELGFTSRNHADLKAAIEITNKFKVINPNDPARYDFVLTRFGIRPEMNYTALIASLKNSQN
ncbi:MAG: TIGR02757 family protein [Dissulfurimicrobium sp.]|uniref:TIGR02757 family protein n=1 Tax=Dissulfurimicrobium sp. TaxID=2022436 RepID=UPI0040493101